MRFAVYTILDSDERCRPLSQEGVKSGCRDFPAGLVVLAPCFKSEGCGSFLVRDLGPHVPHSVAQKNKT